MSSFASASVRVGALLVVGHDVLVGMLMRCFGYLFKVTKADVKSPFDSSSWGLLSPSRWFIGLKLSHLLDVELCNFAI